MTTGEQLQAEILAHPADDTLRLVFADWLQERGTDAGDRWAAMIRRQVALAAVGHRHRGGGCPRCALERENVGMCRWADSLLPAPFARCCAWRRGFVETVVADQWAWLAHRDHFLAAHPVERIAVRPAGGDDLAALGRALAGVRRALVLGERGWGHQAVVREAAPPGMDLTFLGDPPWHEWLIRNWLGRDWQGRLLADRLVSRDPVSRREPDPQRKGA